jgi:DNA-directed RNA polymerase subunit M/transcription elongation factor TFIIS
MFSSLNDEIRDKSVKKINIYIKNEYISRCIERDIYNTTINICKEKNIKRYWDNHIFKNLYLNKCVSLYSNINPDTYIQNKTFLNRIFNKEIDYNHISSLHITDIFPETWKDLINKKIKIDKLKYENKTEAMTSLFKCRRCGSKECSYYEVQTRSADEPMTQFITCIKCNNRWKE